MLERVLSSTKRVVKRSSLVRIDRKKLKDFARKLKKVRIPKFKKEYYPENPIDTIQFLFIVDSLNFSFFPDKRKKKWKVSFSSKKISGSFGLVLSLKKYLDYILNSYYLKNVSEKELEKIFNGYGKITLIKERKRILNEVGRILIEKFDSQVINLLKKANHSAESLIEILVKNFPCFRDICEYKGRKVYFLKKAQLFVADLFRYFDGKTWGYFKDIDKLTAFADYRLPQLLYTFGVIKYADRLHSLIKSKNEIKHCSIQEIEIRANTIWTVEYLKEELIKLGRKINSFEIDWILWNMSKKVKLKIPHHRTRTIYY